MNQKERDEVGRIIRELQALVRESKPKPKPKPKSRSLKVTATKRKPGLKSDLIIPKDKNAPLRRKSGKKHGR